MEHEEMDYEVLHSPSDEELDEIWDRYNRWLEEPPEEERLPDPYELSESMHLSDLAEMRLLELAESYPEALRELLSRGELEEYLEYWEKSAREYLEKLLDPSNPAGAWKAAGVVPGQAPEDGTDIVAAADYVRMLAWDMMIREKVLQEIYVPPMS